TGAGYRRLSGGGLLTPSGDWDSGNPAFAISRGSSRRAAPYAWARPPVSWHAIVPFAFRLLGQPSDPVISPLISARCAGDIALRLVAQQQRGTATYARCGCHEQASTYALGCTLRPHRGQGRADSLHAGGLADWPRGAPCPLCARSEEGVGKGQRRSPTDKPI